MNLKFDDARFSRELPLWALRGLLCAAPSAFWAVMCDFRQPAEIAAMVFVTGLYIVGFTWFSVWEVMTATPSRRRFVRALKMSAWIKPTTVIGVGGVCALLSGMVQDAGAWIFGVVPDLGCGVGSIWLTCFVRGHGKPMELASADSLGWTALTTLMQGALISGLIVLLAAAVLVWWRVWAWLKPQLQFSPARVTG